MYCGFINTKLMQQSWDKKTEWGTTLLDLGGLGCWAAQPLHLQMTTTSWWILCLELRVNFSNRWILENRFFFSNHKDWLNKERTNLERCPKYRVNGQCAEAFIVILLVGVWIPTPPLEAFGSHYQVYVYSVANNPFSGWTCSKMNVCVHQKNGPKCSEQN